MDFKTRFAKLYFYSVFRYGKKVKNAYGLVIKIVVLILSYTIADIFLLGMVLLN